jgi:hypothetical protein
MASRSMAFRSMAFRPHSRVATSFDAWMSDAAVELTRAPERVAFLQISTAPRSTGFKSCNMRQMDAPLVFHVAEVRWPPSLRWAAPIVDGACRYTCGKIR